MASRYPLLARLILLFATPALLGACASGPAAPRGPGPVRPVDREVTAQADAVVLAPEEVPDARAVALSPEAVNLAPREKRIFTAVALDDQGRPIRGVRLTWRVRDPLAGTINAQGVFTAGTAAGVYENAVEATVLSGGSPVVATATVSVTSAQSALAGVLAQVTVYPQALKARPGQVVGLGALGWDERGNLVRNLRMTWRMRDPRAGSVDQIGFFTASQDPGDYPDAIEVVTTQVSPRGVIEQGATVSVAVTEQVRQGLLERVVVLPRAVTLNPGQRIQFTARGFDEAGQRLGGVTFSWEAAEERAGSMSAPGLFTGGATPGVYAEAVRVVAVQRGPPGPVRLEATVSVTIEEREPPSPLAAVQILPETATLSPGQRFVFTARGVDALGRPVLAKATWRVAAPQVGTIDRIGSFIAGKEPGAYPDAVVVEMQWEGGQVTGVGTATVNITGPLERVEVLPAVVEVQAGQSARLTVQGYDARGLPISLLRLRWAVRDPRAGVVNNAGVFTAGRVPGRYEDAIVVTVVEVASR